MSARPLLPLLVAAALALVLVPTAVADLADETALAEKFAPVVRLVEQEEECGPGEPYEPMDVDALFGDPTVALRGPWNAFDLVKIGPTAADIAGLYEYHLDFPGNALDPGCTYEQWARRLTQDSDPAVYAHVASERTAPRKLALQYWFFYPFNDFNNTHEGDWEMIQLVFDADDAADALDERPVEVGYSSHEGAEKAAWDDEKLEIVGGTHPVVYPAAGSHANKFTEALYLGSSAEAGVGCDDTQGPHRALTPDVLTIPSDPAAAAAAFPWITFEGRWGELQKAFFNWPTGPNMKTQWLTPIEWSEDWRDRSYAVPTGGLLGTSATDFFCSGVERGSAALSSLLRNPPAAFFVVVSLLGLLAFVVIKATWTPVAALRVGRRRAWGQILSASASMYVKQPRLFLGLGLLLIPITVVTTLLQWLLLSALDLVGSVTGDLAGVFAYVAIVMGATLTLLGLALVMAATSCALVELDAGRPVGPAMAYRLALRRIRPLLRAVALFVVMWVALTSTVVLIPFALWFAVRWALLAPVAELEDRGGRDALRRSAELVRGHWLRVGSLVVLGGILALLSGPLLGALLIFVWNSSLVLLNLVAGIVYAVALPFVALVTSYVYFDARTRHELDPRETVGELPAEIALDPS